jgi:hypothetical protein
MFAAILALIGLGSAGWIGLWAYRRTAEKRALAKRSVYFETAYRGPAWFPALLGNRHAD